MLAYRDARLLRRFTGLRCTVYRQTGSKISLSNPEKKPGGGGVAKIAAHHTHRLVLLGKRWLKIWKIHPACAFLHWNKILSVEDFTL